MKPDRRAGDLHAALERTRSELERTRSEIRELNRIGVALMTERDPGRLVESILTQARALTTSDAGRLFLVERSEERADVLHLRGSQNDSLPDPEPVDLELPIDQRSITGYTAISREPLV